VLSAATVGALIASGVLGAAAFEERAGEKDALKACEQRICDVVARKAPKGPDVVCSIGKTWKQEKIRTGIGGKVAWRWGDARCSGDVNFPRATMIEALTKPELKVNVPLHTVRCELEQSGGRIAPVVVTLAPTLTFRNGEVHKIWVNLKSVEAPSMVKATIWTTARLEDSIGIFHRGMVRGVNRFLRERCAPK
jgi:hypothetical protein